MTTANEERMALTGAKRNVEAISDLRADRGGGVGGRGANALRVRFGSLRLKYKPRSGIATDADAGLTVEARTGKRCSL